MASDTGQQILCFARCQLTITYMFNVKEGCYNQGWNFVLSFITLLRGFLHIVWPSVLSLNDIKILKTKAVKNICIQDKIIIWFIFNLGLASTCFQTTWPCLQQGNLSWAPDPIENQHLVRGPLQKNMWPWWAINLGTRCDHVILVSGYFVLTGVNWP